MKKERREARLKLDLERMQKLVRESSLISFDVRGNLPEQYMVRYRCTGLGSKQGDEINEHRVHITLGIDYPERPPTILWQTPIFHPNIKPPYVCILGEAWKPKKLLDELVLQMGEMIQYKNYNVHDPLDRDAAEWVRKNPRSFPVDHRELRDRLARPEVS